MLTTSNSNGMDPNHGRSGFASSFNGGTQPGSSNFPIGGNMPGYPQVYSLQGGMQGRPGVGGTPTSSMQLPQQVAAGRYGSGGMTPVGLQQQQQRQQQQQQQMGQYTGRGRTQLQILSPESDLNGLNSSAPGQSGIRAGLAGNMGLSPGLGGTARPGMDRIGSGAQSTMLGVGGTGVNAQPGGGLIGMRPGANQAGLNLTSMNGPQRIGNQSIGQLGGQLGSLSLQNNALRSGSGGLGLPGMAGGIANPSGVLQQGSGPEFSIQTEDFPALPSGANAAGSFSQLGGDEIPGLSSNFQHGLQQPGGNAAPGSGYEQQLLWNQQQQQMQQQQQQAGAAGMQGIIGGAGKAAAGVAGAPDRFGLLGLLSVIRMTDQDLTTLALGTDLTTLGLNLNSPENLYKTFTSPWADGPGRPEPEYTTPGCYLHSPPRLQPGYFSKFQQDTLFYIFYSMPGDEAQLYAADELASRGWWFHKELKVWLTRVPNTEPSAKSERYERGSFFVFDTQSWECVRKDNFALTYETLERAPNLPRPGPQPGTGAPQGMAPPPPAPK